MIDINIPNSVTTIGAEAFRACYSLTKIIIPDSVKELYYTFPSCISLKTIHLPLIKRIDPDYDLLDCRSLSTIYIPKGTKEKFEELLQDPWLINKLVEE